MCGIVGFIDFSGSSNREILDSMSFSLFHRGPDSFGSKLSHISNSVIGLAHRRLSIIDLSLLGNQPMIHNGIIIIFNGEIYNFGEIKLSLLKLGHEFISGSDTEVVLHAYEEWGIKCVSLFIGMFSIAIHDTNNGKVFLFRDRLGVKPLYYFWDGSTFLFASELKAFYKHPKFDKIIDISSLKRYFELGYVNGPSSIFCNTFKLEPGSILEFDLKSRLYEISKYWDISDYFKKEKLDISYSEAKERVHELLISSYNYRMVSDVPVGVFLSGGYDSTSVAAILTNSNSSRTIKTFTIGFDEGNNEAPFAKNIANFLGTEHHEWYCSSKNAQEQIYNLAYFFDEPFADSSAIPTLLLSQNVKTHVSVSLSADGGDEIFGGYNVYNTFLNRYAQLDKIPKFARSNISNLASWAVKNFNLNDKGLYHVLYVLSDLFDHNKNIIPSKLFKSYHFRNSNDIDLLLNSKNVLAGNSTFDDEFKDFRDLLSVPLTIDTKLYLCDDILTKVDRSSMAYSLEGREPMLDHRLIEFVAQIPSDFKGNKKILKDIVHDYVPMDLMKRPKSGFSVPLENWLRNDLKFIFSECLDSKSILKSELFNSDFVEHMIKDFLKGSNKYLELLWRMIQFQLWYKRWISNV